MGESHPNLIAYLNHVNDWLEESFCACKLSCLSFSTFPIVILGGLTRGIAPVYRLSFVQITDNWLRQLMCVLISAVKARFQSSCITVAVASQLQLW